MRLFFCHISLLDQLRSAATCLPRVSSDKKIPHLKSATYYLSITKPVEFSFSLL